MLSAFLLAGLVAAPVATVGLLLLRPVGSHASGRRFSLFRFVTVLFATAALAALTGAALWAFGTSRRNLVAAVAVVVATSVIWMPITRRWSALAHLAWSSTILLFVAYLAFMLQWTFASHLGVAGTLGGLLLWCLELAAAALGCAYLWELCDSLGLRHWRRRVDVSGPAPVAGREPFVSLHVPAHNEPPDMVIETLRSLRSLDYSNYEIVVVDDNSDDQTLWRPVEAWCRDHDVKFVHLDDWPGYKSGALNFALRHLTDERADLVGVVDSDYQLKPDFLKRCAPLFDDPGVGFVQAPQDYRAWEQDPFYRRLYYSYRYFFAVSQPSRNERDGAIFAGTMGLINRRALLEAGGWDEWCITEDAELSLRILGLGYTGRHVDASFGKGVMPLTFEGLKRQRFRWCFGGVQILRRHWRTLLPRPRTPEDRLDFGQRWAYLSGAIQWYGDLVALIFFAFLLAGAANVALGGGLLFRKLSGFLVAAVPFMVLLGLVRAVGLMRRGTGASWRDALGALMIWQSTAIVVARACVQGLYAREAEFLRTPKTGDAPTALDAVRGNWAEMTLAVLGVAGIAAGLSHPTAYAGPLTAALLLWPTLGFAAAPINSLAARRAALPSDLEARRKSEYARSGFRRRVSVAAVGIAAAGGITALTISLLAPGSPVVAPQLVRPAQGHHVQYGKAGVTTTTGVDTTLPGPATTLPPPTILTPAVTSPPSTATATTKPAVPTTSGAP
jgi:cellulose synthase/poly-beta-1,6-N-acetylglucosamine synthase-like glycosyltransferase